MLSKKNQLALFAILSLLILVAIISVGFYYYSNSGQENNETVQARVGEKALILQVRSLNRLETVEEKIRSEIQVEFSKEVIEIFGITILEDSKVQTVEVTGNVVAGIDLSKVEEKDVEVDLNEKSLKITFPQPEIFTTEIIAEETKVVDDEESISVRLKTVYDSRLQTELSNTFLREINSKGKQSLRKAACQDEILEKARNSAQDNFKNIFQKSGFEKITVEFSDQENSCI